jgi:hypothetical protein
MQRFPRTVILLLLIVILWGWWQSAPAFSTSPTVPEIARNFTKYQPMTKEVVNVNPELSMLCRGASQAQVERARLKFGPHAHTGILI